MLIDSHCHLDYLEREGNIISDIVERAQAQQVQNCITIGTKWSERDTQINLSERFPAVFATLGTHPNEAASEPLPSVKEFIDALSHPKVIGIGESGLDYYRGYESKAEQRQSFLVHIEAARQTGLPIVIHCRDADEDMADLLLEEQKKGAFSGLIHCFSGTQALADTALALGMYLSISGVVTFKKSEPLCEIIKTIPLDRLLVETDSPYLAPVPYRGKQNEPAFVRHTADRLAELKGVSWEVLAQQTTKNCRRLFTKADFNR